MTSKEEIQTVKLDGQFRVLTKDHFDYLKEIHNDHTLKTEALNLFRLVFAQMDFEVKTENEGALVYLMERLKMPISWHKTHRNFDLDYKSYLNKKQGSNHEESAEILQPID